ncbi:MAG: hypothetical protein ABH834_02080, partial [Candidatus Altiarchaeota archaeon]
MKSFIMERYSHTNYLSVQYNRNKLFCHLTLILTLILSVRTQILIVEMASFIPPLKKTFVLLFLFLAVYLLAQTFFKELNGPVGRFSIPEVIVESQTSDADSSAYGGCNPEIIFFPTDPPIVAGCSGTCSEGLVCTPTYDEEGNPRGCTCLSEPEDPNCHMESQDLLGIPLPGDFACVGEADCGEYEVCDMEYDDGPYGNPTGCGCQPLDCTYDTGSSCFGGADCEDDELCTLTVDENGDPNGCTCQEASCGWDGLTWDPVYPPIPSCSGDCPEGQVCRSWEQQNPAER